MSHINDLLNRLCPEGVERRPIGDWADLVRGHSMPKTDFTTTGVGAIHYGQIYTYYGTWTTQTISHVAAETAARLAKVNPGDLIITNTSENLNDVGKAVAWLGPQQIVTGGHASVLKHSQDPKFLAYWFQTPDFALQKRSLATGTKVIDVSAANLTKISVPLPPLDVQRAIADILDTFAKLEAELEAELRSRRAQYRHYRDELFTFRERERERERERDG
ncbi:MAG: restriction endonuclease subunit S [Actinomycetales bacterium]|jgi:type I restriction enzyme S subunit|uniref:Restriction endonuclease subunit S n=1 Tax=Candidatus Phosphoribacter hodrii TaxID=2953743 RepID=A0A934X3D0_9MICO|nr:restriction endonuclease subunit S [Candidatus Phosphoribacter hodrii]OPZ52884.1 MAG: putative type-1 restriction enzyme specificity protein [bacterium ADurb.BinA028]HNV13967.1 restriction endonuclease subunit S [Dermatophilaceae bacterium]MBK7273412.1 restriction endonuclease subunit S [Candidatus Phosphoribacter hodrii]HOA03630.1 restriction endonuclease subunit S [Dermatophilaceae bacterium]